MQCCASKLIASVQMYKFLLGYFSDGTFADLLLVLGVGVRIIDDHRISRLQIEAAAGCANGQQEDEHRALLCIEPLNSLLPVVCSTILTALLQGYASTNDHEQVRTQHQA